MTRAALGYLVRSPEATIPGTRNKSWMEAASIPATTISSSASDSLSSGSAHEIHDNETTQMEKIHVEHSIETDTSDDSFAIIDPVNISWIVHRLLEQGFHWATEERGDRFRPTRECRNNRPKSNLTFGKKLRQRNWNSVYGTDIRSWTLDDSYRMAVTKTRGIVLASPEKIVQYLMNSENVSTYEDYVLKRTDVQVFQEGIYSSCDTSPFGIAGECKIVRTHTKIPLQKELQRLSILHAQPVLATMDVEEEEDLDDSQSFSSRWEGAFIVVQRQAYGAEAEDVGQMKGEVLLSSYLIRPAGGNVNVSEITSISNIKTSKGMPTWLVNKFSLSSASRKMKALQGIFNTVSRV